MMMNHRAKVSAIALGVSLLSACATPQEALRMPRPIPLSGPESEAEAVRIGEQEPSRAAVPTALQQHETPKLPRAPGVASAGGDGTPMPPLGEQPVGISVQDMPVQAFATEVFAKTLGLTVNTAPEVARMTELVSLQTPDTLRPGELFQIAQQVLSDYGVNVLVEGEVIQLELAKSATASAVPPLIISGRAQPEVPISHRPVFQLAELEVVRTSDAQRWLTTIFGSELQVRDEPARNALLISGKPAQVRQALDALRVFDRPLMRGRISTRLEPAFMPADQLATRLVDVLTLQGYAAGQSPSAPSSIIVMPIATINTVLVFASTQEALDYTVTWARELDRASPTAGTDSLFYYQVRNTKASDIASILNGVPSDGTQRRQGSGTADAKAPGEGASTAGSGKRVMVDAPRNALIFQGDAAQWERILRLVRQMDRAPRQAMIEVTIAEVTLDDSEEFGIGWLAKAGFGRFNGTIQYGSLTGSGDSSGGDGDNGGSSGSAGLSYLLDVAGQNRAALRAFATDQRVSILSTPRLMVKSGEEASIDVGTEVPTITAQTTSNQQTGGSTNLLQSIQYRKTGIILNVTPTIYSNDRIDLDIEQEVSDAIPAGDGASIGSPSIFNRSVSTSLSLKDGGSVVLGGLMSTRQTGGSSGIPGLKDVPVLGNLFKTRSRGKSKTELVLMIVPYIIESDDRATELSQAIIERFDLLDLESIDAPETGGLTSGGSE